MYAKSITISGANVLADLAGFPLRVMVSADAQLGAHARADGFDVRFTTTDGTTVLPHHRFSWTKSGGNVTAEFYIRCNISTSGTTIRMEYGNPNTNVDPSTAAVVWQDYDSVHRLVDYVADTGEAPDISGNERHLTDNRRSARLTLRNTTGAGTVGTVLSDYNAGATTNIPMFLRRAETGTDRTKTFSAIHFVSVQTYILCMCARHDQWDNSSGSNSFRYHGEPIFAIGDNPGLDSTNTWSSPGVPYDHTESFGFFAVVFPGNRSAGDTKIYRGGTELSKTYHGTTSAATQLRPYGIIKCFRDWAPTSTTTLQANIRDFRVFDGDPGAAWTNFEARNLFGTGEITIGDEKTTIRRRTMPIVSWI